MEALRASLEKKPAKRAQPAKAAEARRAAQEGRQEIVHPYGVREVEKLLRLPRSTIRALIDAGFVSPARGPRERLAVLVPGPDRAAHRAGAGRGEGAAPSASPARCASCAAICRRPCRCPGLSICAVADRVVVKEGASRWQAESGQYLLGFEGDPADGSLSVIERKKSRTPR